MQTKTKKPWQLRVISFITVLFMAIMTLPDGALALTAKAEGTATLKNGVLTLSGNVVLEDITGFASNSAVKKVVAEKGTVLPESCYEMFQFFENATEIDLSNADTSNVTNMACMFNTCSKLEIADLSSFDTSKVTNMYEMFNYCGALKTIYVGDKWTMSSVENYGEMFDFCDSLVGGNGTAYAGANDDKEYARIDKEGEPGYLTGQTVSFDEETGVLTLLKGNVRKADVQEYAHDERVTSVVAEEGVVLPTDSSSLFYYIHAESIDLSNADTSNVTNMAAMFMQCYKMTSLDISSFDTSKVTTMSSMFESCSKMTSFNLSSFDTSNVTNMYDMFCACKKLTSLDLCSFDTSKVTDMMRMFVGCLDLETIAVSDKWTMENVARSVDMFKSCTALVGGNGTVFDEDHTDKEYARIDKEGEPGYFTLSPNIKYGIAVGGVAVTEGNRRDILGDGAASYDPSTKTLTLRKGIPAVKSDNDDPLVNGYGIINNVDGLTIKAEGVVIVGKGKQGAMALMADTTFTGGFIHADSYISTDSTITFDHVGLKLAYEEYSGVEGVALRGSGSAAINVISSDVIFNGKDGAAEGLTSVTFSDCKLEGINGTTTSEAVFNSEKGYFTAKGGSSELKHVFFSTETIVTDLTIDGEYITERNKDDILGNGVFSFDADSNTLTVNGDYAAVRKYGVISNSIPGLTIDTVSDSKLSNVNNYFTVYAEARTFFKGSGKLTIDSLYINSDDYVTINSTKLDVVRSVVSEKADEYDFYVCDSTVNVGAFSENIGVFFYKARVTAPEDAVIKKIRPGGSGYRIYEADGETLAKNVHFEPYEMYDVYIKQEGDDEGVYANIDNADDILGDGRFRYDKASNTLYISGEWAHDPEDEYSSKDGYVSSASKGLNIIFEDGNDYSGLMLYLYGDNQVVTTRKPIKLKSISVEGYDEGYTFTLKNADIEIEKTSWCIEDHRGGKSSTLKIVNSHLKLNATDYEGYTNYGAIANFKDIILEGCDFEYPEGNFIEDGNVYEGIPSNSKRVIAKKFEIVPDNCDLYVLNKSVNTLNAPDILGDGRAVYDPDAKKLTLNGDFAAEEAGTEVVLSRVDGLTVFITGDSTFAPRVFIDSNYDVTVNGNRNKVKTGLIRVRNGAVVTIDNIDLTIESEFECLTGYAHYEGTGDKRKFYAPEETLIIKDSSVKLDAGNSRAISNFKEFKLEGCDVVAPEKWEYLTLNEDYYLADSNTGLIGGHGLPANEVEIKINGYGFSVGDVEVDRFNQGDILGDKSAVYDGIRLMLLKDIDLSDHDNVGINVSKDYKGFMGSTTFPILVNDDITLKGAIASSSDLQITGKGKLNIESPTNFAIGITDAAKLSISDITISADKLIFAGTGRKTALELTSADITCPGIKGFKGGITLDECSLVEPAGAQINAGSVVDADGNVVKDGLHIKANRHYGIFIDGNPDSTPASGIEVTDENCEDVFNAGNVFTGAVTYDPETNTLYLNKSFECQNGSFAVYVKDAKDGLTINVTDDVTLDGNVYIKGVECTITGDGTLTAPYVDEGYNGTLTLKNAKVKAKFNAGYPGSKLVIDASDVDAEFITNYGGGITLINSKVISPEDAVVGASVYEADGETVASDVVIRADKGELVFVEEKAPTCEEPGNIAHYVNTVTGKTYADAEGTEPIESVVIPPIGHKWGTPAYKWEGTKSCSARRVCNNDETHVETETVTPVRTEEDGKIIYTADFVNTAFETQVKVVDPEEVIEYSLWVNGEQVTSKNADDILGNGNGELIYNPATLTLNINGSFELTGTINSEIEGLTINVMKDATITAPTTFFAIQLNKKTTITGSGKLTIITEGDGGFSPIAVYDSELNIESAKIDITSSSIAIADYDADISIKDSVINFIIPNSEYGIFCFESNCKLDIINSDITVTPTESYGMCIFFGQFTKGITLTDCYVESPEDIDVFVKLEEGDLGNPNELIPKLVIKRGEKPAVEKYDLWVNGEQVTSKNCDDILGTGNGELIYNPATNILNINGSFELSDYINSEIEGLTVYVMNDATITSTGTERVFFFEKAATVSSKGSKLTVKGGDLSYGVFIANADLTFDNIKLDIETETSGIRIYNEDSCLTFKDSDVNVVCTSEEWGTAPICNGGSYADNCVVKFINTDLTASTPNYFAISSFKGGVTLTDCYVASPNNAIFDEFGNLVDDNGKFITSVVIKRGEKPAVEKYDLWVNGEQVTSENADDILGNGKNELVYSPSENCLVINDSFELTDEIRSEIDGLIVFVKKEATITSTSDNGVFRFEKAAIVSGEEKLTIKTGNTTFGAFTAFADLSFNGVKLDIEAGTIGVLAYGKESKVTFKDSEINIVCTSEGWGGGKPICAVADTLGIMLTIINTDLTATTPDYFAITGFNGQVTLNNCYIASPENAGFNNNGDLVYENGNNVASVVIKAGKKPVETTTTTSTTASTTKSTSTTTTTASTTKSTSKTGTGSTASTTKTTASTTGSTTKSTATTTTGTGKESTTTTASTTGSTTKSTATTTTGTGNESTTTTASTTGSTTKSTATTTTGTGNESTTTTASTTGSTTKSTATTTTGTGKESTTTTASTTGSTTTTTITTGFETTTTASSTTNETGTGSTTTTADAADTTTTTSGTTTTNTGVESTTATSSTTESTTTTTVYTTSTKESTTASTTTETVKDTTTTTADATDTTTTTKSGTTTATTATESGTTTTASTTGSTTTTTVYTTSTKESTTASTTTETVKDTTTTTADATDTTTTTKSGTTTTASTTGSTTTTTVYTTSTKESTTASTTTETVNDTTTTTADTTDTTTTTTSGTTTTTADTTATTTTTTETAETTSASTTASTTESATTTSDVATTSSTEYAGDTSTSTATTSETSTTKTESTTSTASTGSETTSTESTSTTSQTTTASTTDEPVSTTTTGTTPEQPDFDLGDVNEDGKVDAKDASRVLVAYARLSTGSDDGFTEKQRKAANVNGDDKIDAKDASAILAYYAMASTAAGDVPTMKEFMDAKK